MKDPGLRIGLFGGAFDPVHNGHVNVAGSFLNSHLIDELHLLPTPFPPHKELPNKTTFHHRFKMLQIAFSEWDRVVVNGIENQLSQPSYSLQTIKHLQDTYPSNIYFLCIGEDNLSTFHEWHQYREILDRVTLMVAARPGIEQNQKRTEILEKAVFVAHDEIEVSSTDIRNASDPSNFSSVIPDSVLDYIQKHKLL